MPLDQRLLYTCANPKADLTPQISTFLYGLDDEVRPVPLPPQPTSVLYGASPPRPTAPQIPGVRYGWPSRYYNHFDARMMLSRRLTPLEHRRGFRKWQDRNYSYPRPVEIMKLLGDHVNAVIKNPDRVDLFGELFAFMIGLDTSSLTKLPYMPLLVDNYTIVRKRYWDQAGSSPEWVKDALLPSVLGYFPIAKDDGKISFYATVKALLTGKRTITTPGRYLKRVYPTLPDHKIRDVANVHNIEYAEPEIKIARSESECIRVVAEGPGSCMANSNYPSNNWFKGHVHPAAVYGYSEEDPAWKPDTEILYFEDTKGKVKARVICNAVTKACARIYGDDTRMQRAMVKLGYRQEVGALKGARIRNIENENGYGIILPYVDAGVSSGGGDLRFVVENDRYLRLGEHGPRTYMGYEHGGVAYPDGRDDEDDDTFCCDSCGETYDNEDANSTFDGRIICDECRGEHYSYAIVSLNPVQRAIVHDDDSTYVHGMGDRYLDSILDEADIYECQYDGRYYHIDDLLSTPEGYVHMDHAVTLDEEYDDCSYAMKGRSVETHDGRTIHEDHSVQDYFTGDVYCEDDDDIVSVLVEGRWFSLTAESTFKHIDGLSALNGVIRFARAENDAVPLRDYLLNNDDTPSLTYKDGDTTSYSNPIASHVDMHALLTKVREMLLNKEETECEETDQMAA